MNKKAKTISAESGGRVRAIREALGMNQQEMADAYGSAQSTINRYEKGYQEPPGAFIKFLHDKYRMNYDYYTTGKGQKFETGAKKINITDVVSLKNTVELHEARIKILEEKMNGMIREVYAMKHGIEVTEKK